MSRAQVLDGVSGIIAQFSKCDFWNLGDFLNRNMKPDYVRPDSGGESEADFSRTCTRLREHAVANLKKYTEQGNVVADHEKKS